MKKMLIMVVLVFYISRGHAQIFNEWFQQQKTQIEYLLTQIAGLQTYIGYAKKGYKIVDEGLATIGNLKNGDFQLHKDFLDALKNVNPKIRHSAQVAEMISLQVSVVRSQKLALQKAHNSDELTPTEKEYIGKVYARLLEQAAESVEALTTLITSGNLALSDDERLQRIDMLHTDMQDKYRFVRWFAGQTEMLTGNRKKETGDSKISQSLLMNK